MWEMAAPSTFEGERVTFPAPRPGGQATSPGISGTVENGDRIEGCRWVERPERWLHRCCSFRGLDLPS